MVVVIVGHIGGRNAENHVVNRRTGVSHERRQVAAVDLGANIDFCAGWVGRVERQICRARAKLSGNGERKANGRKIRVVQRSSKAKVVCCASKRRHFVVSTPSNQGFDNAVAISRWIVVLDVTSPRRER